MKRYLLLIVSIIIICGTAFAQTYVGPEKCLNCHNNVGLGDMTMWRTSVMANGYSAVLDDTHSMQDFFGVVNDYNQNLVDDFKDGLDFNTISSVFDPFKPNAPILAYSETDGYTITIGEVTHKVILTYGGSGNYKQRYALQMVAADGNTKDLYISPIQYNEVTHEYVLYHADDWYDANNEPKFTNATTVAEIPPLNSRSLAKGCAGCHLTGLTISKTSDGEWLASGAGVEDEADYADLNNVYDLDGDGDLDQINTACESCHGPGSDHAAGPSAANIINPSVDLTATQANNMCGKCHTRGKSLPNNTFSYPFDDENMTEMPLGALVADYYTDGGGYYGDGINSSKHHQQFFDLYRSSKPTFQFHEVTCYECHDVHNNNLHNIREVVVEQDANDNDIDVPTAVANNTLCLSCHATHGPFENISVEMVADYDNNVNAIGTIVSEHSNHSYDPAGNGASNCVGCHMAKTNKSAIHYDVVNHTFKPIQPEKTKEFAMPNSCAVGCHREETYPNLGVDVSGDVLSDWSEASDIALAEALMIYYGPGGQWWDTDQVTGVKLADHEVPNNYTLAQNYPNPFNPATIIEFSIPDESDVSLKIFDAIGKEVELLVNETKSAGNYKFLWDASQYSSGIYFYKLQTKDFVEVKKMILMK